MKLSQNLQKKTNCESVRSGQYQLKRRNCNSQHSAKTVVWLTSHWLIQISPFPQSHTLKRQLSSLFSLHCNSIPFNFNGGSKPETRALRAQQWNHAGPHHQCRLHNHVLVCAWQRRWFNLISDLFFLFLSLDCDLCYWLTHPFVWILKGRCLMLFSVSTRLIRIR